METIKQIDKNGRLTIPSEIADLAAIKGGDFVKISYDAETNRVIITPLELKERTTA